MKIYLNNFKKLSVQEETNRFEITLDSNDRINKILKVINSLQQQENFFAEENSTRKSESIEQFRTDKRKSISFNNTVHLSNLTINDVFEDISNVFDINSNEKSKRLNFNENIQMIIEEDSNLNTLTYNYNKNAFQQLRTELACDFEEKQEENPCYSEIDHEAIKSDIER